MEELAYAFWQRVDELKGGKSLKDIANDLGVSYATVKDMRSRCRYPKQELCSKLASYLSTSVDYLMTGKHRTVLCSEEARYVDDHPEAQVLVRALMRDSALLSALSAVIESTEKRVSV